MRNELRTGNVETIASALRAAGFTLYQSSFGIWALEVASDMSEVTALRAECAAALERHEGPGRDKILCGFQLREYGLGARSYVLSENVYGYCVGDHMASNIGGGRFSQTPRGMTLEEAILWGIEQSKRKNVSFTVYVRSLPAEVCSALELKVGP